EDKKENLWKIITGKFAFESRNSEKKIKRRIMRDILHKWKSWKCELKKSSYDLSLTIDEIIASQTDKRVDTSQFKNLVTRWFTEDKHVINQYLLQKAVVKFVDVVEEVDTISDIDIRNNSLNKNPRSATRRGIIKKNQGQDGDAKATLFNLEPTAETFISNECLVEKESEVEVPVCKSIAIKKEDQGLYFMSCARKCNGQCMHSEHQSANQKRCSFLVHG
nr:hypothetical protein [Tanacetum cinerariifolium]